MAKDDYHVIVYQILAYLYTKLKAGEQIDGNFLKHDSPYLQINEKYWVYILENLVKSGLVTGITITKSWGDGIIVSNLDRAQITPAGIEYLCNNSFIEKAKEFLKDIKAIVPFV